MTDHQRIVRLEIYLWLFFAITLDCWCCIAPDIFERSRWMKSTRAMMAMMALAGVGGLAAMSIGAELEPRRNYDLEGPKPKAGPPTQVVADVPSRQMRRKAARLAAKKHR